VPLAKTAATFSLPRAFRVNQREGPYDPVKRGRIC
jgi:hypothetical protein